MKFKLLEFYYTTLDEDILYIKCSTERETNVLTREIKMFREGCDVERRWSFATAVSPTHRLSSAACSPVRPSSHSLPIEPPPSLGGPLSSGPLKRIEMSSKRSEHEFLKKKIKLIKLLQDWRSGLVLKCGTRSALDRRSCTG